MHGTITILHKGAKIKGIGYREVSISTEGLTKEASTGMLGENMKNLTCFKLSGEA